MSRELHRAVVLANTAIASTSNNNLGDNEMISQSFHATVKMGNAEIMEFILKLQSTEQKNCADFKSNIEG